MCIVTASESMAVRERCDRTPSGLAESMCRWGVRVSMSSRKNMPSRKPPAAGSTLHLPAPAFISMQGMSSDHTEAATMTPEAKPSSTFCSRGDISWRMKKTNAEPSIVPRKGTRRAMNTPFMMMF